MPAIALAALVCGCRGADDAPRPAGRESALSAAAAAGPPSAATSTLKVAPASPTADGSAIATITAKIRDAAGKVVPNQTVTFGVSGSNNTLTTTSGVTDSKGVVTSTLSSTTAELKTVTASVNGFTLTDTVTFVAGPPGIARSWVTATPGFVRADGVSVANVHVLLLDDNGNPVTNHVVRLSASGGKNTFTPASGNTDAAGVFDATLASTRPQTETVTATAGGGLQLTTRVTFSGPPATLFFFAEPASGTVGTPLPEIQVYVVDAAGNIVPNATNSVVLAIGSGPPGAVLSGGGPTPAVAGTAVFASAVVDRPGSYTLLAASSGLTTPAPTDSFEVIGPPVASRSSFTVSPNALLADGQATAQLTVHLVDSVGHPVPNQVVSWSASGGGNIFAAASAVSDENGQAVGTLASAVAESKTVTATLVGFALSASVEFLPAGCASPLLLPGAPSLAVGAGPRAVVAADLDADGKLDLISADYFANGISVILGNGDGTFRPAQRIPTGRVPPSLIVADLDGNGRPDIAVVNEGTGDSDISVLLGNGDGTFNAAATVPVGNNPHWISSGDFDGDHRIDLVTANLTVDVLLGNGDGSFRPPVVLDGGGVPVSLALGDFDDNGTLDIASLALESTPGSLNILLGNGDGSFRAPLRQATSDHPNSIATADVDGDGRLDLAVADNFGLLTVHLGHGDGTFTAGVGYPVLDGGAGIQLADLNLDGKLDLVAGEDISNAGAVLVLLGNGDGTFGPATAYPAGEASVSLAIADLNGDGRPDVAVGDMNDNDIRVLLGSACSGRSPALAFTMQSSGTSNWLSSIWGSSSTDLYAVGSPNTILHSSDDGHHWIPQSDDLGGGNMYGIWGASASDLFVLVSNTTLERSAGDGVWTNHPFPSGGAGFGIWGNSPNNIFIAAGAGGLLHSTDDGASWTATRPAPRSFTSVFGTAANDVWAVANNDPGTTPLVFHSSDGVSWTAQPAGNPVSGTLTFSSVWASAPNDAYVVGSGGTILHSGDGGATWVPQYSGAPRSALNGVWGSGPHDVYVSGGAPSGGIVLHSTGDGRWTQVATTPSSPFLSGTWGTSASDVFAVGDRGAILHHP